MFEILPDYILIDIEAPDANSIITLLADKLQATDAVGSKYASMTIEREKEHPTGLPTKPFAIAIPHADADDVRRSAIAMATLQAPVAFRNMGDPDEDLAVELVFLLATHTPEEQIKALRNLATVFGEEGKLEELQALKEPASVVTWLETELGAE